MKRRLEFDGGRLVKVDGMRPEYMGGHEMIGLIRELGAEVQRLRACAPKPCLSVDTWEGSDAFPAKPE